MIRFLAVYSPDPGEKERWEEKIAETNAGSGLLPPISNSRSLILYTAKPRPSLEKEKIYTSSDYLFLGEPYNPIHPSRLGDLILEGREEGPDPLDLLDGKYVLFQIVIGVANLSWVLFFLSLGTKYLNFNSRLLQYCNEALLPFYILHQTVIIMVGWFVVPLDAGILPKYLIISVSSFVLILTIYEVFIRRLNPVRWLFGMRLKKKSKVAPVGE